jgi:hypothetical protein
VSDHPLRHDPFVLAWESVPRLKDGSIPWTKEEIDWAKAEAEADWWNEIGWVSPLDNVTQSR